MAKSKSKTLQSKTAESEQNIQIAQASFLETIKNFAHSELRDIGLDRVAFLESHYGKDDLRVKKAKLDSFFRAYSVLGTVRYAAQVCGLNPAAVANVIKKNEAYGRRFDQAHEEFCQYLEQTAVVRALTKSDTLLMFMLRANNPNKFSERLRLQALGQTNEKPVQMVFGEVDNSYTEPNYAVPQADRLDGVENESPPEDDD